MCKEYLLDGLNEARDNAQHLLIYMSKYMERGRMQAAVERGYVPEGKMRDEKRLGERNAVLPKRASIVRMGVVDNQARTGRTGWWCA